MDGTEIAVAAVAGTLAVVGTLLGAVVKGRIDRRQFDAELAARRTDQLLERRLAAGAAMVEKLRRARESLDACLADADDQGCDVTGGEVYLKVPRDRPHWLMEALHAVELTGTPAVIDAARTAATTCWDAYRDAVMKELRALFHAARRPEGAPGGEALWLAHTAAADMRQEVAYQAMDAEERLRDAIRAESSSTPL